MTLQSRNFSIGRACVAHSTRALQTTSLAALYLLGLVGCAADTQNSEVIATVAGDAVTMTELWHETQAFPDLDQDAAVEQIVRRKLLVARAKTIGLDLDSTYHFAALRNRDDLLVDALKAHMESEVENINERDLWIQINEQPWRYSQRVRIYLTRVLADGSRSVLWVDTGDFVQPPPKSLSEVEVGSVVSLHGREWNVEIVEEMIVSPDAMLETARARRRRAVSNAKLETWIAAQRSYVQTSYRLDFRPNLDLADD